MTYDLTITNGDYRFFNDLAEEWTQYATEATDTDANPLPSPPLAVHTPAKEATALEVFRAALEGLDTYAYVKQTVGALVASPVLTRRQAG